jgi:lipopolysaccharide heptosyltransferase I
MRLLIVRLGALGDIVHTVPALAALRRAWPDAHIDWLVDSRYRAVLDHVRGLDTRIVVETTSRLGRLPGVIGQLRASRYDIALDFQGLVKSAALARAAGSRRTAGFARAQLREPLAASFYSERYEVASRQHVIRKNLALVQRALGIDAGEIEFPLETPATPPVAGAYALLNPGAGWPNKRWPAERFATLAAWIKGQWGWPSIVLWGPRERSLARSIAEASYGAAQTAPETSIGDLLALARGARLMISGDTGPIHLAAAVRTPIVGLYGPTDPARNGPFDPADVCLSRFATCVCHHERRCRRRRPCVNEITLEEVQQAIQQRLSGPPVQASAG